MIVGKCWSTVGYRRLDENTNTWLRIEVWYTYSDKIMDMKVELTGNKHVFGLITSKEFEESDLVENCPRGPSLQYTIDIISLLYKPCLFKI